MTWCNCPDHYSWKKVTQTRRVFTISWYLSTVLQKQKNYSGNCVSIWFNFEVKATSHEEIFLLACNKWVACKKNFTCILYLHFLCSTTCMIWRKRFLCITYQHCNFQYLSVAIFVLQVRSKGPLNKMSCTPIAFSICTPLPLYSPLPLMRNKGVPQGKGKKIQELLREMSTKNWNSSVVIL